jgi:hypothetical protein
VVRQKPRSVLNASVAPKEKHSSWNRSDELTGGATVRGLLLWSRSLDMKAQGVVRGTTQVVVSLSW